MPLKNALNEAPRIIPSENEDLSSEAMANRNPDASAIRRNIVEAPDLVVTPAPRLPDLEKNPAPLPRPGDDLILDARVRIVSPLPEQSVVDLAEISWAPAGLKLSKLSYTARFSEAPALTKGPVVGRRRILASVNAGTNLSLMGALDEAFFTPGGRYMMQVSSSLNNRLVGASIAVPFFFTPPLRGPILSQTRLVPIQLVIREEKDPATGKVRKVYYFFRNKKWFQVIDPKRKHPKDPQGIDLRENIQNKNFRAASAEASAALNKEFFPAGWEKAWQQFDESSRVQLQILAQLGLKLQGVDPKSVALLEKIKKQLAAGKSVDSIFQENKIAILKVIVGIVAAAVAGAILGRLFRLIFRQRWLKALTQVDEAENIIRIRVKENLKAIKDVQKGLDGAIVGQVERKAGRLYCPPSIETVVNTSGKKGAATDLFREWFKILKAYAKKKGLKQVKIERTASTEDGVKFLKRLGFKPTTSNKNPKGIGNWELILPVK